jgi:hypothetical protein
VLLLVGGSETNARRLHRRLLAASADPAEADKLVQLGVGELFAAAQLCRSRRFRDRAEHSDIARRAGAFLEINYAGGAKDQRIARGLGISPAAAGLLRRGHDWTAARFDQASQVWPAFRGFVFAPPGDHLANQLRVLGHGFACLGDMFGRLHAEILATRPATSVR